MDLHLNMSNTSLNSQGQSNGAFRWIKVSIASIVTFLIIFNNLINLSVLWKMRELGARMKVLLLSLSTSDICLGFIVCLPGVVSGILSYWPFGDAMCQITGTMNGVAISVSLWCLMAISIERFFVVHKPLLAQKEKRIFSAVIGVAFIWTFNTFFYALPIFLKDDFLYYTYDHDVISCSFQWESTAYFLVAKALYPVLSGTVLVVTSVKVHLVLKKAEIARKKWFLLPSPNSVQSNILIPPMGKTVSESNLSSNRVCPSSSCSQDESRDLLKPRILKNDSKGINPNFNNDASNVGENPSHLPNSSPLAKETRRIPNSASQNGCLTNNSKVTDGSSQPKVNTNSQPCNKSKMTRPDIRVSLQSGDTEKKRSNVTSNPKTQDEQLRKNGNVCKSFQGERTLVQEKGLVLQSNMMPKSTLRREMKAKLLLLCTSAIFFTAISPYSITSLVEHFASGVTLPHWLKFLALWVLNTNSFINVYIYSAIYAEFRMHCKVLLYRVTCKKVEGLGSLKTTSSNGEAQMSRKSYQKLSKLHTNDSAKQGSQAEELPNPSLSSSSSPCSTNVSNLGQGIQVNVSQQEDTSHSYSLCRLVPRDDSGLVRDQIRGSSLTVPTISSKERNSSPLCSISTLTIEVLPSVEV